MKLALLLLLVACQAEKPSESTPTNGPRPGTQLKVGPKPAEAGVVDPDAGAHVADAVRAIWDRQVRDAEAGPERKAAEDMRMKLAGRLERHCRDDAWSVDAPATPPVDAFVPGATVPPGCVTCRARSSVSAAVNCSETRRRRALPSLTSYSAVPMCTSSCSASSLAVARVSRAKNSSLSRR